MIWYAIDWFLLVLAIGLGKPHMGLACLCVAELAAGAVIPPWPGLAITDLVFGTLLWTLNYGARANFIAFLFAIMAVTSAVLHGNGFPEGSTSAIVDAIAWLVFGVLGHVDSGISKTYRLAFAILGRNRRAASGLSDLAVAQSSGLAHNRPEEDRRGMSHGP